MNENHYAKRALYVIGGLYLVAGLALTAHGAFGGRVVEALCGFLITNIVIIGGWLVLTVGRISAASTETTRQLEAINERLARLERLQSEDAAARAAEADRATLDLAALGRGDPSVLAGAILDRSIFPRLASAMEDRGDAGSARENEAPAADRGNGSSRASGSTDDRDALRAGHEAPRAGGPGIQNFMRRWRVAIRAGDVAACREVLSTLLDTADPTVVGEFQAELDALIARTERDLRRRFTAHVRAREYDAAADVGREIVARLPDSPIADDFRRIESHLAERAEAHLAGSSANPHEP